MATESIISIDRQKNWYDDLFNPENKFKPVFGEDSEANFKPLWDTSYRFEEADLSKIRHLTVKEIKFLIKWNNRTLFLLKSKLAKKIAENLDRNRDSDSDDDELSKEALLEMAIAFFESTKYFLNWYAVNRDYLIQKQEDYEQLLQKIIDVYENGNLTEVADIINDNFDMIVDDINKVIALDPDSEEAIEAKKNLGLLIKIREDVLEIKGNVDNLDWDNKNVVDDLVDIGKDFVGAVDRHVGENELNEKIKEGIKNVEDLKQEYDENFN
jgi:hypothetical protein